MTDNYSDAGDDSTFMIDVDTTNAIEQKPVPSGEYQLTCVKAEGKSGTGKNGEWRGISMLFDIPNEISAGLVSYMVFLPSDSGTEKQKAQAVGRFKTFKEAFNFGPTEVFSPQDLVGKEVWATLSLVTDPEYGDQNKVQRFIVSQG